MSAAWLSLCRESLCCPWYELRPGQSAGRQRKGNEKLGAGRRRKPDFTFQKKLGAINKGLDLCSMCTTSMFTWGHVLIPFGTALTHWEGVSASAVCVGCVLKPVCVSEGEEMLKSLEGDFLWKGMLSPPPLRQASPSLFPASLPRCSEKAGKRRRRSERGAGRSTGSFWTFWGTTTECTENGVNFTYSSRKAAHCHVDVLQPASIVDVLNMASLL